MKKENPIKDNRLKRGHDLQIICMINNNDYGSQIDHITISRNQSQFITYFTITFNLSSEKIKAIRTDFDIAPQFQLSLLNYFSTNSFNQNIFDKLEFKLMMTHEDTDMSATLSDNEDGLKNSSLKNLKYTIYAMSAPALLVFSRSVNKIYYNKTTEDIVKDIASKASKAVLKIEHPFENKQKIDQCLIPPMNIIKAIEFVDFNYGFYNGTHQIWITDNKDKAEIKIFNPKKYINKYAIKIIGAQHGQVQDEMKKNLEKSRKEYKKIVINENDISIYRNTLGFNLSQPFIYHFIQKPVDQLYKDYNIKLEGDDGLVNNSCFIDKRYAFRLPPEYRNKWSHVIDHTGFKDTTTIYNEWFAKNYEKMSGIVFSLEGFVDTTELIPGHTILYEPVSDNLKKLKGNYKIVSLNVEIGRFNTEQWRQITTLAITRANSAYEDVTVQEVLDWINDFVNAFNQTFSWM